MSQLTVEHLKKSYQTRTVVQDISLQINSGEIVGLLGPTVQAKLPAFT
jgi:lipopolysaccharide export system ATP-binding protein